MSGTLEKYLKLKIPALYSFFPINIQYPNLSHCYSNQVTVDWHKFMLISMVYV